MKEKKEKEYQIIDRLDKKIRGCFNSKDYNGVIKYSNELLKLRPEKNKIRFMRARSYRKIDQFDKAISDLKYILNDHPENQYALLELFNIYYLLHDYDEATKYLPALYNSELYSIEIYDMIIKKSQGLEFKVKCPVNYKYVMEQIQNYSETVALDHIKKHLEPSKYEPNRNLFNNNINVDYLFECVKNNIPNSKTVNKNDPFDIYYYSVFNIGKTSDNSICNYIKTVVVPNTTDIITLYPIEQAEGKYCNELNCDYDELIIKQKNKIKTMSMIDKFNKRYGINN